MPNVYVKKDLYDEIVEARLDVSAFVDTRLRLALKVEKEKISAPRKPGVRSTVSKS